MEMSLGRDEPSLFIHEAKDFSPLSKLLAALFFLDCWADGRDHH